MPTHSSNEEQLWLIPVAGQFRREPVAVVAVGRRTPRVLSYSVPPVLRDKVTIGSIVRVPVGRRGSSADGVCVDVVESEWDQTRPAIQAVHSIAPLLTRELAELGLWVADYYACPPGRVFEAMIPVAMRTPRMRTVVYVRRAAGELMRPLSEKRAALLAALQSGPQERRALLRRAACGPGVLASLRRLGVVAIEARREPAAPRPAPDEAPRVVHAHCAEDDLVLTPAQEAALASVHEAVRARQFGVHLLFGVPGSGKTEVYVRAIRAALAAGRQAILLVPEIVLATQLVERLATRFERVAVLHSRLAAATRQRSLRAIADGAIDVVIGTRTAVFAPLRRLGLIVVDEEQDGSYKSLSAPYVHARDVAIKRGQIERVPVVLGSATPALETWYNAQHAPHFHLARLPERVPGAAWPEVRVVPSTGAEADARTAGLSPALVEELRKTLAAGAQTILLHNRRGYAVGLRCVRCRTTVRCERCAGPLVYHAADEQLKCHRCAKRRPAPKRCPDETCGAPVERVGFGIQRIEEELRRVLPAARLLRLDRDTLKRRADYAEALRRVQDHEVDVLLGTQLVAKGLDFAGIRLVGVIDADAPLWLPDFRSAERVFQLVAQVVGRAGRRAGDSLALVQAADVTAPCVAHAARMDFETFAAEELAGRRTAFLPPFSRLVRFVLADDRPRQARDAATALETTLRELAGRVSPYILVDAATRCLVARTRERLRWQVIVRTPRDDSTQTLLRAATAAKALWPRVRRFTIDVDPIDLL
ncbi:MAG: primosomal protein N' [Phycisphaerae bacterium]